MKGIVMNAECNSERTEYKIGLVCLDTRYYMLRFTSTEGEYCITIARHVAKRSQAAINNK